MNEPSSNLLLFRFRLLPAHLCRNLYFWDVGVADAQFVCTRDLLSASFSAQHREVQPLLMRAKTFATALVDVHAYLGFPTMPALDIVSEGWVKVARAGGFQLEVGYSDPSVLADPLDYKHADNVPFASATPLLNRCLEVPGLSQAMADFRAARQATAAYAPIFAYRTLEDVAMGISGVSDPDDRKRAWQLMNERFQTTPNDWEPLTRASTSARHGNPLGASEVTPADVHQLLKLTKRALELWVGQIRQDV